MKFSRYHFSDKFLEISLVFTHGITPAWVNHNRCFVKKMHLDVLCNARASCYSMKTTHGKISRRTRDLNVLGGAVWILPGVAKILVTLLSTGAFATDEQGMARVLMHPPARMLETNSHE